MESSQSIGGERVMASEYIKNELHQIADDVMDLEYKLSEKRRQRDALIMAGRTAGLSLRAMAEACLVSHQTIANILDRESGAAGEASTTTPPASRA
jgi:hypothetical protein